MCRPLGLETHCSSRVMEPLTVQLQEIDRVVPAAAVVPLRKVPLWFSPEYLDVTPRAEYHPDADWLRENKRDPAMEKAVDFTNFIIFELETNRMPNFALHELLDLYPVPSEWSANRCSREGFGSNCV